MKITELEVNVSKINPELYIFIDSKALDIKVFSVNNNILVNTIFLNQNLEIEVKEHISSIIATAYIPYTIEVQVEKNTPNVDIKCILLDEDSNFEDFESSDDLFLLKNDYFLKVKEDGI